MKGAVLIAGLAACAAQGPAGVDRPPGRTATIRKPAVPVTVSREDGEAESGDPGASAPDPVFDLVRSTLGDGTRAEVVELVHDYCVGLMVIHGRFDSPAKREATKQMLEDKTVIIDGQELHVRDPVVIQKWLEEDPRAALVTDLALDLKAMLTKEEEEDELPLRVLHILHKCYRP